MEQKPIVAQDWATLRGHYHVKRLLEIAASGNHALLLVGPPQVGNARIVRSLVTILAGSHFWELEQNAPLDVLERSERGIVFLNRLEQWSDDSLARLRELSARSSGQMLLVATTSFCLCENTGASAGCTCETPAKEAYQSRLRKTVDACFALLGFQSSENQVATVFPADEPSRLVRDRVEAARQAQARRNGPGRLNSMLTMSELERAVPLVAISRQDLATAHRVLPLSPEQDRFLLQVTRTIEDLDTEKTSLPSASPRALAEALSYLPVWDGRTR